VPAAEINGQKIAYDDAGGNGPPVVLSHGFLMDRTMFDAQVAVLRDRYRVVTWDERGFGETEFDGKPFTYWDSAKDLLGLMDHLEIDRAVLGGMSQGGFLSLRAALLAPERVRALILLNTQAGIDAEETTAGYRQMLEIWKTAGPVDELANTVATIIIDQPGETEKWIAKWRSRPHAMIEQPGECLYGRDDITDRLSEITAPALVVHGLGDTAIHMDRAEALAGGLSGSGPVVQVPGAHAANLTHPDAVNAAITTFLDALPA
jgi:pimeloyl-ACP methyl ester carboxylesterase